MPIGVRRAIISFGSIVFFFSNFKIHTRECVNKAIESLKVLCYIFRHVQFSCQSTVLIENGLKLFTKSHFNFKGIRGWYFITKLVLTYCENKNVQVFEKNWICKIFEISRTIHQCPHWSALLDFWKNNWDELDFFFFFCLFWTSFYCLFSLQK